MAWFNIPVILRRFYYPEEKKYYVSIRPVFYEQPQSIDVDLNIAKNVFIKKWKNTVEDMEENLQQKMLFYPDFTVHKEKIDFEFDKIVYHLHLWMIYWQIDGAMVWYTHLLDNFLYITPPADSENEKKQRIYDCLTIWIRTRKKICPKENIAEDLRNLSEFTTLSFSEIAINYPEKSIPVLQSQNSNNFKELLRQGLMNCRAVGEPVYWNENRADLKVHLSKKLQDLESRIYSILAKPGKKSILLCGPEYSGRKHILTKVFQALDRDFNYKKEGENYIAKKREPQKIAWYFTPGKIISGMSTVGEWEKRIHSILAAASYYDFILYFDQIVGLLETGKHDDGNLAVTDILLSAIKSNRIRVVVKATKKQLHILSERNRSLADQFEIIPMPVLSEKECDSIYIDKIQTLEEKYSCCFDLSVIPYLKKLTAIYESEKSTPGVVCSWLTTLALLNKNT